MSTEEAVSLIETGQDPNSPKKLGSIIGETDEQFEERWLKNFTEAYQRNPAKKAFDAAVDSVPCQKHSGIMRRKNEELSVRVSAHLPIPKVVYDECPSCKSEREDEANLERWKRNGVPAEHFKSTFDNFQVLEEWQQDVKADCQDFAKREFGFLLIHGGTGTGKDHLSVAIAKNHRWFVFRNHSRMLRSLRESYSKKTSVGLMDRLEKCELLIISDIGTSVGGKDADVMHYDLIDYRASNRLKTILNTNLDLGFFKEVMGERIMSRVQGALFRRLEFFGTDWRKK